MSTALANNWWAIVIRGVLAILFGILAIILPGITLTFLVLMFGAYVLLDGVFNVLAAWSHRGQYERWWIGFLEGLVGIFVGIATFLWPGITGLILLYLTAFWAVLTGLLEIFAAVELRKEIKTERLLGISGLFSIVFGGLLMLFPITGALAVAWIIGLYALVFGVTLVVFGLQMRSRLNPSNG